MLIRKKTLSRRIRIPFPGRPSSAFPYKTGSSNASERNCPPIREKYGIGVGRLAMIISQCRFHHAFPQTGQAPLGASGFPSIVTFDCVRVEDEIITGRTDDEGFSSHSFHGLGPWFVSQILETSGRENSTGAFGFISAVFTHVGF